MRMRVVEVSGKTVDEAVERALEQLGLRREQVDVDVIREGKGGFLGFGGEDAIVRVTAKAPVTPSAEPAAPRAPRPPREARPPRLDTDQPPRERTSAPRGAGGRGDGGRGRSGGQGVRDGGGDRGRGPAGGREEMRPRGRPVADDELQRVPGAPTIPPTAPPEEAEDQLDFAGRTLRDVLNLLGLTDTEIAAREPETAGDGKGLVTQVLDIYGNTEEASDGLGLLIGRRGDTLSSLQYLMNVLVSTKYGSDYVLGLDVEQYRKRREQALVEMALRIAAEVRETGDVITLEPMSPAERRIVHITLEDEPGVRTESVGSGPDRQVEVLPAEAAEE